MILCLRSRNRKKKAAKKRNSLKILIFYWKKQRAGKPSLSRIVKNSGTKRIRWRILNGPTATLSTTMAMPGSKHELNTPSLHSDLLFVRHVLPYGGKERWLLKE